MTEIILNKNEIKMKSFIESNFRSKLSKPNRVKSLTAMNLIKKIENKNSTRNIKKKTNNTRKFE